MKSCNFINRDYNILIYNVYFMMMIFYYQIRTPISFYFVNLKLNFFLKINCKSNHLFISLKNALNSFIYISQK